MHPKLNPAAGKVLQQFYIDLRQNYRSPDSTPITTRQVCLMILPSYTHTHFLVHAPTHAPTHHSHTHRGPPHTHTPLHPPTHSHTHTHTLTHSLTHTPFAYSITPSLTSPTLPPGRSSHSCGWRRPHRAPPHTHTPLHPPTHSHTHTHTLTHSLTHTPFAYSITPSLTSPTLPPGRSSHSCGWRRPGPGSSSGRRSRSRTPRMWSR